MPEAVCSEGPFLRRRRQECIIAFEALSMHEFHHGLGHVQHGCKNEVVLPLSLALCNIFVLRAMSSFHHLSFQSQLGSLLFSLLLQVITLCRARHRPRCAFWLSVFALSPCHVPLPLASPCARRGTPEVRLWLSVFVPCLHVMLLPRHLDIYVVT